MAKKHKGPRMIHERLSDGRHRIVVQNQHAQVIQDVGDWAASHELAVFQRYRANRAIEHLPVGIFKVVNQQHDSLRG